MRSRPANCWRTAPRGGCGWGDWRESRLRLVGIDIPAGRSAADGAAIAEAVYTSMVEVLNVPKDDRFEVNAEHSEGELVIDPTYLGIRRSKEAILIQVTLNEGRSVDVKRAFYRALADGLHEAVGLRREDALISLVEVKKENWSFGNGEAQYAEECTSNSNWRRRRHDSPRTTESMVGRSFQPLPCTKTWMWIPPHMTDAT